MSAAAGIALVALALVSSPTAVASGEDVSALLLRKTQVFSDAGQRGDGAAMAALLDDRVVFFNEGGDRATKADMAANVPAEGSPGVTTRMTVTDGHCEVHGDVAVASFVDDQRQDWHGQPFHARYRSVETWRREGGDWRMIASETIALRDDPAAMALPAVLLDDYVGTYEAAPGIRFAFTRGGRGSTLRQGEVPRPCRRRRRETCSSRRDGRASPNCSSETSPVA